MTNNNLQNKVDKKLSGVCGIFCPACIVYLDTQENPERLKWLADRMGCTVKEMECNGCRSDKLSNHCQKCNFTSCAKKKKVEFCIECSEYPCDDLKVFQNDKPHRVDLWKENKMLKECGHEKWYNEMIQKYSCPECQTVNAAYNINCRKCGADPSSQFVKNHKNIIEVHLKKTSS